MNEPIKFKTFKDLRSIPADRSPAAGHTSIGSVIKIDKKSDAPAQKRERVISAETHEIAPVKDFQKVPNSVTRRIMAQGIFRGKSKQVWDYLWSVSRGAINPTRFVTKSRNEIKIGSGLGSMVTVDAAIEHLVQVGLLEVVRAVGSPVGNRYEIFAPEEIKDDFESQNSTPESALKMPSTYTSNTSNTRYTSPIQKLDELVLLESSNTSIGYPIENKDICKPLKTYLKDKSKNDDDMYGEMLEVFEKSAAKFGGKKSSKNQKKNWTELAELLVAELELAAARTESISNVPAFLTEHLRRRLSEQKNSPETGKGKIQRKNFTGKNSVSKKDSGLSVGKPLSDSEIVEQEYTPEPLTEKARATVLQTIKNYPEKTRKDFALSLEKTYTREDWEWFLKQIGEDQPDA